MQGWWRNLDACLCRPTRPTRCSRSGSARPTTATFTPHAAPGARTRFSNLKLLICLRWQGTAPAAQAGRGAQSWAATVQDGAVCAKRAGQAPLTPPSLRLLSTLDYFLLLLLRVRWVDAPLVLLCFATCTVLFMIVNVWQLVYSKICYRAQKWSCVGVLETLKSWTVAILC